MIEVTEEMIDHVYNWRSKSPSPNFALEHTVRAIIELHEANKPTQKPLSEEEIEKLVPWQGDSKDPFFNRIEFARAIEQAHGIECEQ